MLLRTGKDEGSRGAVNLERLGSDSERRAVKELLEAFKLAHEAKGLGGAALVRLVGLHLHCAFRFARVAIGCVLVTTAKEAPKVEQATVRVM